MRSMTSQNQAALSLPLVFAFGFERHSYTLFSTERVNNSRLASYYSRFKSEKYELQIRVCFPKFQGNR